MAATVRRTPGGFIPSQDQGYLIASIQLPPGASLERTDKVVRRAVDDFLEVDGVKNAAAFAGFSGATRTNASNAGAIFLPLEDFDERTRKGLTFNGILAEARRAVSGYEDAFVIVIQPPPVRGVGTGGGFKMMLQDRGALGWETLSQTANQLAGQANQIPGLVSVFTLFETSTPQLYADIDLVKAEKLGVPPERVFETLEVYLGSSFVNDFNYLGRTYRVTAQADAPFRQTPDDVARLRTRNNDGDMVPIGSVARFSTTTGPQRAPRHNLYPAAEVQGDTSPGTSSGEAIERMERLAANVLPLGMGYEWTELAFQQKRAGNTAGFVFALAVVFVFLVLAAQYESWSMPLAVILIVPMCLLSAIAGVLARGMSNDILVQIGLIVLVGLASKNAILIVEFARNREREGKNRFDAAKEAAAIRLRPILMTSVAFILGVVPLALAEGAGAEMRQALGTSVFFGMLGVTLFGLLFTPAFYVLTRRLAVRRTSHDN